MILAENGYLCYAVEVHSKVSIANKAREEFERLMGEISCACMYTPKVRVILGTSPEHGITEEEVTSLGADEFRIKVTEDAMVIAGGTRGLLYGVYDFFERFLGVRYLAYDAWHIPKKSLHCRSCV